MLQLQSNDPEDLPRVQWVQGLQWVGSHALQEEPASQPTCLSGSCVNSRADLNHSALPSLPLGEL